MMMPYVAQHPCMMISNFFLEAFYALFCIHERRTPLAVAEQ
jgi:hypothetical protein